MAAFYLVRIHQVFQYTQSTQPKQSEMKRNPKKAIYYTVIHWIFSLFVGRNCHCSIGMLENLQKKKIKNDPFFIFWIIDFQIFTQIEQFPMFSVKSIKVQKHKFQDIFFSKFVGWPKVEILYQKHDLRFIHKCSYISFKIARMWHNSQIVFHSHCNHPSIQLQIHCFLFPSVVVCSMITWMNKNTQQELARWCVWKAQT